VKSPQKVEKMFSINGNSLKLILNYSFPVTAIILFIKIAQRSKRLSQLTGIPKVTLIHGTSDKSVRYTESTEFAFILKKCNMPSVVHVFFWKDSH